ncbi:hypothetical protein BD779DRAFT_1546527 [Infundibulicybe gibba]|nr:hypothetical protein BD779DRAFT_1546527 [Infundibulicybe gibba]
MPIDVGEPVGELSETFLDLPGCRNRCEFQPMLDVSMNHLSTYSSREMIIIFIHMQIRNIHKILTACAKQSVVTLAAEMKVFCGL